MRKAWLTFTLLAMASTLVQSQEIIPLTVDDIARMGIVFAPVTDPDRQSGSRFPATVINSPEAVSQVVLAYPGTIERWYVMPGEAVSKGQRLADLHSQEVLDLQNRWLTASAEQEHAEFMVARDTQLFEKGIISRQRLLETEHDLHRVTIEVVSLSGALARAGFDRPSLEKLADDTERLGVFRLLSPAHGILTTRLLTVGQYAGKYQVVASLGADDQPWLRARVPARYAGGIEPGDVLSLAGVPVQLTVRSRELAVHETTQTLEVLAEFNSPVNYMAGQVLSLVLPASSPGVEVPGNAVVHSGEETVVYVRTANGVEARVLNLEPAGGNYVAGSGLRAGEQLVIQGAALLKGVQLGLGEDE